MLFNDVTGFWICFRLNWLLFSYVFDVSFGWLGGNDGITMGMGGDE